jgi:multidrug efflux pump subunit AcrB
VGHLIGNEIHTIAEVRSYVLTTGDTGALNADVREGGRVGSEYGEFSVELVDQEERARSQTEIVEELRDQVANLAGVEIELEELSESPPVGAPVLVRVKGSNLAELEAVSQMVRERIAAVPEAQDVRIDYDRTKPEIRVELDRQRAAAEFGVSPETVSGALGTAFRGTDLGRMWVGGQRVDIRLQAPDSYRHSIDGVRELPLRGSSGEMIPLGETAKVGLAYGHNAIFRHDTHRSVTVRANAAVGASTLALEAAVREQLADLRLPAGVRLDFGGEREERDRSYASLWSALKWGALLIFFIMAIQFNSLRQPLIVLLGVPLSVVGVALGLLVTGTPFSFMVFIGIVSLTGVVVNDGIVLVDAINQSRRAGMSLSDAIRDASSRRFRPVLLTTVTTIAGLLPLTLNVASGGEFWVPLGITIISGLLVASGLTLFVVPVLYSILEGPPSSWAWARAGADRLGDELASLPATRLAGG